MLPNKAILYFIDFYFIFTFIIKIFIVFKIKKIKYNYINIIID